jgi:hypothetical protein
MQTFCSGFISAWAVLYACALDPARARPAQIRYGDDRDLLADASLPRGGLEAHILTWEESVDAPNQIKKSESFDSR